MNSSHELGRLLEAVYRLPPDHGAGALATLVRTTGSTYRHAGTSMLVDAGGNVTCPLAGGCPQRDLVQRALRTIAAGVPEIARYDRETGLDVLIETGCDGELEVLIEPLSCARDRRFLDALGALHARRVNGFMATVYACDGIVLSPRPLRLIQGDGVQWSNMDDALLAGRIADARCTLREGRHAVVRRLSVGRASFDVLFESLQPAHRLVIFGANVGALALARLAVFLGWDCVVADRAPGEAGDGLEDVQFVRTTAHAARQSIAFDRQTSVVTMTHNLEQDVGFLRSLAGVPLAYVGMIGSRDRAACIRARLPATMHVHAPAGLDIGSETPEEIALAVTSEILTSSNARTAGSLAASAKPIHA